MKYLNLLTLLVLIFINGCTESYEGSVEIVDDIEMTHLDLRGKVVAENRQILSDVSVTLRYHNLTVATDDEGYFDFKGITATNDMMILQKEGYYDAIYTYNGMDTIANQEYMLKAKNANNARLLFTGDLSFARRFMNPASLDRTDKLITSDVENATLKVSHLRESGQALISPILPLFKSVDFPTVNFESIATKAQTTLDEIHPTKDFAYYTDSGSLGLLKDLGISFVTLGNNHVFDYRSLGLSDTMRVLKEEKISFSGAGESVEEAFIPYRTTVKGNDFSFIGATSIRGDKHEILYVAHEQNLSDSTDTFVTQGGAGDAKDKPRLAKLFQSEKDLGTFPIYQFHGGIEYTFAPNSVALGLMNHAIENNASLVISHHPHTAQGYGMKNGVFMAYGMGNFIFDQDRLDTLLSHILVCDIEENNLTYVEGYPIYIEDYVPKLLTGDIANRFIRHISEASRNGSELLEKPFENDFMLFPYHYKEYMPLDGKYHKETKTLSVEVEIAKNGSGMIDLRHLFPSEYSLSSVTTQSQGLTFRMGRDLLWFGSFEDNDVDELFYENSIWNLAPSVSSSRVAYHGKASAHLYRDESHSGNVLLYFGRRIRVIGDGLDHPNKNLSFYGYFKGDNSRPFSVESRYYGSIEEETFGNTMLIEEEGGTFDWKAFDVPIEMPQDTMTSQDPKVYLAQNARALKFFIRMQDLEKGKAHLYVDDLAVISWEESFDGEENITLSTPHNREFVRVSGEEGLYRVSLSFDRYTPQIP